MTIAIALRRPGLCPRAAPRRTSLSSVGPDKSPFPSCRGGPGRGLPPQIGTLSDPPPQAGEGVTTSSAARFAAPGDLFPCSGKKIPCYPPEQGIGLQAVDHASRFPPEPIHRSRISGNFREFRAEQRKRHRPMTTGAAARVDAVARARH